MGLHEDRRDEPLRDCLHAFPLVEKCRMLLNFRDEFLAVFGPTHRQEPPFSELERLLDDEGAKRLEGFWILCAQAAAELGGKRMRQASECKILAKDLMQTAEAGRLIIHWWDRTGPYQFQVGQARADKVAKQQADWMAGYPVVEGHPGKKPLTAQARPGIEEDIIAELARVEGYVTPPKAKQVRAKVVKTQAVINAEVADYFRKCPYKTTLRKVGLAIGVSAEAVRKAPASRPYIATRPGKPTAIALTTDERMVNTEGLIDPADQVELNDLLDTYSKKMGEAALNREILDKPERRQLEILRLWHESVTEERDSTMKMRKKTGRRRPA